MEQKRKAMNFEVRINFGFVFFCLLGIGSLSTASDVGRLDNVSSPGKSVENKADKQVADAWHTIMSQ